VLRSGAKRASLRYNLVGAIHHHLLEAPYGEGNKAIAIWVDTSVMDIFNSVMDIFNGPDWDKGQSSTSKPVVSTVSADEYGPELGHVRGDQDPESYGEDES
jgi:hypothetical protein